jgi:CRISPR-associated protein Cmr5
MRIINKLENGRAQYAYRCAEDGKNLNKPKEYKSHVKKIPMLIKTNGIGPTFAFIFSKKSKDIAYEVIYQQISGWFRKDENPFKFEFTDFEEKLCELDSQHYRAITNETLALLNWLRRFADGLIEGD